MSREYFESIVQFLNFGEKPLFGNDRLSNLRMILDHLNEVITPELDNTWKKSFDWWVYDVMAWTLIHQKQASQVRNQILRALYAWWSCFHRWSIWWSRFQWWIQPCHCTKTDEPISHKGYQVFTDNYYISVALTEFFSKNSTYATGTLRKDLKGNSKKFTAGKPKKNMKWFGGQNEMLSFVNGKTRVMFLRIRMDTHHKLLPLLIALK